MGKYPSEVYNLPPGEKEFVYQATLERIKQENKAARKGGKR